MTTCRFPLDSIPAGAVPHRVTAGPVTIAGRAAVRVELLHDEPGTAVRGIDHVDAPTFLVLPVQFSDGSIDVDVRSRLNGKGLPDARAFAGIAYRISPGRDRFDAVYLRPLNGLRSDPPPPRRQRAVQQFSYPGWPFDRLRATFPDGRHEAPADIGPDEWIHLRLGLDGRHCTVTVDGRTVLDVDSRVEPVPGAIGLFVDTGTEAFFADLTVTPTR